MEEWFSMLEHANARWRRKAAKRMRVEEAHADELVLP